LKKPTYNLGDLIDRLSILTRKIYFGDDNSISEHRHLERALTAFGINGKLITNTIRITQANIEIWNLEHEIRNGGEGNLGLEEVGKRALKIRDINRKRISYKNNITAIDKGFSETKINHRSG